MVKRILKNLRRLLARRHLREITFTLGTITFGEWLAIVLRLLFKRKDIVDGKYIRQFEDRFAQYLGAGHAFSFGAGRMAFYAILKAMGIKEGDEVILPAYTCVVVPNAVVYAGARPVYVDIEPYTLTIDVSKIEEKVTPKTKAILAQHMFASFCDMEAISRIANKYGLKVIEDSAHALGADYGGRKAGNFGDAAFFTMEQSKIITSWMGGVAVTNDAELAYRLREIQGHTEFLDRKATTRIVLKIVLYYLLAHPVTFSIGRYFLWLLAESGGLSPNILPEEMEGSRPEKYPVRLSNLQAMIGLRQLKKIEANLEHRRQVAAVYEDTLKGLGISINKCNGYKPSHIRYAFWVKDRPRLEEIFQNSQAQLGEWYNSVVHPRGSSLEALYYETGSCPAAEFAAEHCGNLPTHPKINRRDVKRITRLLQQHSNLLLNPGGTHN